MLELSRNCSPLRYPLSSRIPHSASRESQPAQSCCGAARPPRPPLTLGGGGWTPASPRAMPHIYGRVGGMVGLVFSLVLPSGTSTLQLEPRVLAYTPLEESLRNGELGLGRSIFGSNATDSCCSCQDLVDLLEQMLFALWSVSRVRSLSLPGHPTLPGLSQSRLGTSTLSLPSHSSGQK